MTFIDPWEHSNLATFFLNICIIFANGYLAANRLHSLTRTALEQGWIHPTGSVAN